jgi:hypothetical protein
MLALIVGFVRSALRSDGFGAGGVGVRESRARAR